MAELANDVLARLEKVEHENRALKRTGGLIALLALAILLMGQTPARQRTLEAERLVIRYPNGKVAIVLGTEKPSTAEHAQVYLYAPDGSPGAWIDVTQEGGGVTVKYPKGQMEAELTAGPSFASDLKTRAGDWAGVLLTKTVAEPYSRKAEFYLSSSSDGETKQTITSESGAQLSLVNGSDGPSVRLLDNPKTVRAVLGNTSLETTRTGAVETRPLSSLVLFDKEGKVLWRAP